MNLKQLYSVIHPGLLQIFPYRTALKIGAQMTMKHFDLLGYASWATFGSLLARGTLGK
jgi:hypothetical protein